jgi:hypothetical protein
MSSQWDYFYEKWSESLKLDILWGSIWKDPSRIFRGKNLAMREQRGFPLSLSAKLLKNLQFGR